MANITTELNQIANSVYGKDMRSAIHDSIEKVNNDLEKTVVPLSFAEYDALSSAEKLNGSLYFTYDTKQIFMNAVEYTQDNDVTGTKQGNCLYFNAASAPLDRLDISLKPVQNMRGYGEAWAGGRGKNKLNLSVTGFDTIDGITFAITDDARIRANGTSTDQIEYIIGTFSFSGSSAETYILNGCPSGGSSETYRMVINGVYDYGADPNGVSVTLSPGVSYQVKICINSGVTLNRAVFKPMLRKVGDANFRPYANVCPIYKNSQMGYFSMGKNLFDYTAGNRITGAILNERGEFTEKEGEGYYYDIPIAPSTTYTLSGDIIPDDRTMYVYTFDEFDNVRRVYGPISYADLPYTFTAGPLAKTFGFSYVQSELNPTSVMLEVGTLPTQYEAYRDHSTDLDIGLETWGGNWHVSDGYIDEEWAEIQSYANEPLPYEWYSSENTYGIQETPNLGAQVVYRTGTVVRKTTGIIEMSTIKGINTMFGGNNEYIDLTYTNEAWQDIIHYKELLSSDYEDLSEADKNNGTIYFLTDTNEIYLNGISYGGGGGGNSNEEELSYAEYLELTEEEKMNGTNYFIYDINGDGQDFQPVIYSEDEREIGVWTDGRPLYQKTYSKTNVSNSNVLVDSNFTKSVINLVGYVCNGMDMNSPFSHEVMVPCVNGGAVLRVYTNDSGLCCNIDGLSSSYSGTVRFTIQYTKYADAPGSGTWTPQGVPAVHYSTEEKVVGTWVDGSTLYERTFKIDNPTSTANPSTLVNLTNNEVVIDIQGYLEASDGSRLYNNFGDSTDYQLKLWFEVGVIKYRAKYGSSSLTEIVFSIRYTKTSS